MGKQQKQWETLFCRAPKSLQMVIAAMKLKDDCSLEEKLWQTQTADSEKAMATHSSTLAWKILSMEEPCRLQSLGSLRVGHDWSTSLSLFTFMHWRGNGNPLQYFGLENPRDRRAWWAAGYGVAQSRTWLKRQQQQQQQRCLSILEINPLLIRTFANIFSHFVHRFSFILLMIYFAVQKLLSLIRSYLFLLLFPIF